MKKKKTKRVRFIVIAEDLKTGESNPFFAYDSDGTILDWDNKNYKYVPVLNDLEVTSTLGRLLHYTLVQFIKKSI